MPFSIGVMLLATIWLSVLPRRMRMGVCNTCGYSLRGLSEQGVCPECGASFNTLAHQVRVPEWGTSTEHWALGLVPIVIGLLSVATSIGVSVGTYPPEILSLAAIMAGITSAAPGVALALIARRAVGRVATWSVCLAGSLPGAVLAPIVFIVSARASDLMAVFSALVYGATASAIIGSVVACAVAIREEVKMSKLRAKPVQASTPVAAETASTRPDQV